MCPAQYRPNERPRVFPTVPVTDSLFLSAVQAAYDTVASDYASQLSEELVAKPLDRAFLEAFADLVQTTAPGPVADVGCGFGHTTAYLHSLGLDVAGIDLSPNMISLARRKFPGLRFEEGTMTALAVDDGALGGLVARYSIIHLPPEKLPVALGEFSRVLRRGGYALLAFQVGDERIHVDHAYGRTVSLDAYRWPPERIDDLLDQQGLQVIARMVREPDETEKVQQANLLARKPPMSPPARPPPV